MMEAIKQSACALEYAGEEPKNNFDIVMEAVKQNWQALKYAGKELKNNPHEEVKNIPIIMITIDTKERTVLEAKGLGIQEYLVKPISPLALKKRICTALGIKQERV